MAWQRTHCCILLRDAVGEQTFNSYWWQVQKPQPSAVIVARGELLVPISPEDSEPNSSQEQTSRFRPKNNAGIIVECAPEEVFWLSGEEQAILEAVESSETRFQEFRMDRKLKWAAELKVDATVYLRLSDERRKTVAYAESVVRYVGRVGSKLGRMYGVEIRVSLFLCVLNIPWASGSCVHSNINSSIYGVVLWARPFSACAEQHLAHNWHKTNHGHTCMPIKSPHT